MVKSTSQITIESVEAFLGAYFQLHLLKDMEQEGQQVIHFNMKKKGLAVNLTYLFGFNFH